MNALAGWQRLRRVDESSILIDTLTSTICLTRARPAHRTDGDVRGRFRYFPAVPGGDDVIVLTEPKPDAPERFRFTFARRQRDSVPVLGVTLSEELQLHPEQSTEAFVLHHRAAKYFNA